MHFRSPEPRDFAPFQSATARQLMRHRNSIASFLLLALPLAVTAPANAQSILHSFSGGSADVGLGWSVGGGFDVDGDGTPDVISGAILYDVGNLSSAGQVRVFSGRTGATLHTLQGNAASQRFGDSVALVGDLNQDGKSEFAVGIPKDTVNGTDSGSVKVYSGSDASILYQFTGAAAGDRFGYRVISADDVDGDGVQDIAIGAVQWNAQTLPATGAGYVQVRSGANGNLLYQFQGVSAGDFFGDALASAGDINGDGRPDLMVGARFDDTPDPDSGSVSVFSGMDGSLLRFHSDIDRNWFGMGVAGAGDIDGDGVDDYLISAPKDSVNYNEQGTVRLYSGSTGAVLLVIVGGLTDQLGWVMAVPGDLNGDGVNDFVLGSPSDKTHGTGSGAAFVHSGATGQLLYQLNGAVVLDYFGTALASAGDINSDGVPDFIVGAFRDDDPPTGGDAGMVYVISGDCDPPVTYCTAKTNSQNCTPTIYHTGTTSLSGPDDFFVRASNVINQTSGLLFWGFQPTGHPFKGGHLCVGVPSARTPMQNTGGNVGHADCSGQLAYRFTHSFLLAKKAMAGNTVYTQYYSRDVLHPDGTGVSLTAGLRFAVAP